MKKNRIPKGIFWDVRSTCEWLGVVHKEFSYGIRNVKDATELGEDCVSDEGCDCRFESIVMIQYRIELDEMEMI